MNMFKYAFECVVGGGLKVLEHWPEKEVGAGGGLSVLITVNTNVEEIQIYAMLCKWLRKALEMPALFGM